MAIEVQNRQHLYEELIRRLVAALRGTQLYSRGHPISARTLNAVLETIKQAHGFNPSLAIGLVGKDIVVSDTPLPKTRENLADLTERLRARGIERITIEPGLDADELFSFLTALTTARPAHERPSDGDPEGPPPIVFPHIRAGRLSLDQKGSSQSGSAATLRRLYQDAVRDAEQIWDSALTEGKPELPAARAAVDGLAEAVTHNRAALLGLAAMKKYDNYTFTHMVNVSILTMGQARSLGIDGRLLRELGLAGLMHDIGKTKTPLEILNKPDKLDDHEFEIMKRHTVEGAEILRRTPEMPTLGPVVAFEHHLRLDGRGYPDRVVRPTLNIGTMLCGIADVYDAMRSKRKYQESYPSDRILAVYKQNDGRQFEQRLVSRFVHMLGIYPPGSLVRLDTGEAAVVVRPYAHDPYKPRVRVVLDRDGTRLDAPWVRDLWDPQPYDGAPTAVAGVLSPSEHGIDPQTYL